MVALDDIRVDECLYYIERPMKVVERKMKVIWKQGDTFGEGSVAASEGL